MSSHTSGMLHSELESDACSVQVQAINELIIDRKDQTLRSSRQRPKRRTRKRECYLELSKLSFLADLSYSPLTR